MSAKPSLQIVANPDADTIDIDLRNLPARIVDGDYQACLVYHETAVVFNAAKVFLWFRITDYGEQFEKMLFRAYRVKNLIGKPRRNGRFTVAKGSDLLKMLLRVLHLGPKRPDRVSLSDMKNRFLRVRTRTVKTDYKQRALPEALWYSVIDEVLKIET